MTTEQLAAYMRLLELGKSKLPRTNNKADDDHIFLRGWNAGVTFAEEMLVKAMAPPEPTEEPHNE